MPDLELSGLVENGEGGGGAAHQHDDAEQRPAAIKAIRKLAEKRPEQAHRKQTEHGHHRHQKRRIRALVNDDPDRDGFQPAHGRNDEADVPQTPEVGLRGQLPKRRVAHAIAAAIFSADISTGKLVLAQGTTGKIEASATRSPWTPLTRPWLSTTAIGSSSRP